MPPLSPPAQDSPDSRRRGRKKKDLSLLGAKAAAADICQAASFFFPLLLSVLSLSSHGSLFFFHFKQSLSLSLSPATRSSLVSANRFVGTAAVKYPRPGRFQCRCFVALVSGREKPKFRIETNYSS